MSNEFLHVSEVYWCSIPGAASVSLTFLETPSLGSCFTVSQFCVLGLQQWNLWHFSPGSRARESVETQTMLAIWSFTAEIWAARDPLYHSLRVVPPSHGISCKPGSPAIRGAALAEQMELSGSFVPQQSRWSPIYNSRNFAKPVTLWTKCFVINDLYF